MGFTEFMAFEEEGRLGSSGARDSFQWGGTIFALILLILNRTGRRSGMQTTLLVMFLFTSCPTVLFKILRGQFGYWIAFLAVVAKLFFPETFPVSRFLLFVVTPTWVASGLRDSIDGGFCLIIAVLVVITVIQGNGVLLEQIAIVIMRLLQASRGTLIPVRPIQAVTSAGGEKKKTVDVRLYSL